MDFFELIASRESCRDYADRPVEKEKLLKCLEAARIAPSACNSQPWSYTLVTRPELLPPVAKALQDMGMNKFADKAPAFFVVTEEKANLSATVGARLKSQEYASVDIGISVSYLTLAATAQGLSTCIIGWFDENKLKELLDIPGAKRIRLVVAIGYAAGDKLRTKKRKELRGISRILE